MLVRKKCPQCKICVYYSQRDPMEPKITFLFVINGNLIALVPRVFFLWVRVKILLDLLGKTNLEHKEICASDRLKTISMFLTHVLFGFLCFAFQIWLCVIQEAYLQFKQTQHIRALNNDIENFMVPLFYPIGNSTE